MFKSRALRIALLAACLSAASSPTLAAPAECGGHGTAMLVRVEGLKSRTGTLRAQTYGGDPQHYFDKGRYLQRVDAPVPATGPVELCLPVPRAGLYAVSIRHDVDGDGRWEMSDGGGMSGNPELSLMDVIFKRRPAATQVQVEVKGIVPVRIVMNYIRGTHVGPIAEFTR